MVFNLVDLYSKVDLGALGVRYTTFIGGIMRGWSVASQF
jgi:hypothetical protein